MCGGTMHRQSKMCWACWRRKILRPNSHVTRVCLWCGAEFKAHRCHVNLGMGKFCSTSCRTRHFNAKRGAYRTRMF